MKYTELFNATFKYHSTQHGFLVSEGVTALATEQQYTFVGNAVCHLRILQNSKETFVIATELDINPGTSITNAAEALATKILKEFTLEPSRTRFIECYVDEYPGNRKQKIYKRYDEVTFTWRENIPSKPQWKPLNEKDILKISLENIKN